MDEYDYLSDSSSIDQSTCDWYALKAENSKLYLKIASLEEELCEKNYQVNHYKKCFYYALSGCVFWAYFSVLTNYLKI
jgi:hypothetical protein